MKLIAHVIDGHQVDIRPAPVNDWMEATNQRFRLSLPAAQHRQRRLWMGGSVQCKLSSHVDG